MYAYSHSGPESGRCDACDQFFIREASLTKHRRNCSAARKLSRKLWKNGASNVKKLNMSQTASRKRVYDEVRPHEDHNDLEHAEQPASVELVSTLLIFHSFITVHIYLILIGCAAR